MVGKYRSIFCRLVTLFAALLVIFLPSVRSFAATDCGDFTVSPPEGWELADDDQQKGQKLFALETGRAQPLVILLDCRPQELNSPAEAAKFQQLLIKKMKTDYADTAEEELKIGGLPAVFVRYLDNKGNTTFMGFITRAKKVFLTSITLPEKVKKIPREAFAFYQSCKWKGNDVENLELNAAITSNTGSENSKSLKVGEVIGSGKIGPKGGKVSVPGRITVEVPPGALARQENVVVRQVSMQPGAARGGFPTKLFSDFSCFDISLENSADPSFKSPLTIRMSFNPAAISSELKPEQGMLGAFWNEKTREWITVPIKVDTAAGEVIFQAPHLSMWAFYYLAKGYKIVDTVNFRYVLDTKNMHSIGTGSYSWQDMLARISAAMDNSYLAYRAAGFRMPFTGARNAILTGILLEQSFKIWTFVGVEDYLITNWYKPGSDPYRSGFVGALYIPTSFDSDDSLKNICAHELFHAIQNEYQNIVSLGQKMWWAEATADYAADKTAWEGTIDQMGEGISKKFLAKSLFDNDKFHAYQAAHFIEFLIKNAPGTSFKAMWQSTMDCPVPFTVAVPLDKYIYQFGKKTLGTFFSEFAGHLLFDAASPAVRRAIAAGKQIRPSDCTDEKIIISDARPGPEKWAGNLPETFSAMVMKVEAEVEAGKSRSIKIELEETGKEVNVSIYRIIGDKFAQPAKAEMVLLNSGDVYECDLSAEEKLYLVAVNQSYRSPGKFSLSVQDKSVNLALQSPAFPVTAILTEQPFTIEAHKLPPNIKKVEFFWEFGAKGKTRTEMAAVTSDRSAKNQVSMFFEKPGNYTIKVRVFEAGAKIRKSLGEISRALTVESRTTILLDPVSREIEPEKECVFSAKVTNPPATSLYLWNFGDAEMVTSRKPEFRRSFPNEGLLAVKVAVRDEKTGEVVASTSGSVNVVAKNDAKISIGKIKSSDPTMQVFWSGEYTRTADEVKRADGTRYMNFVNEKFYDAGCSLKSEFFMTTEPVFKFWSCFNGKINKGVLSWEQACSDERGSYMDKRTTPYWHHIDAWIHAVAGPTEAMKTWVDKQFRYFGEKCQKCKEDRENDLKYLKECTENGYPQPQPANVCEYKITEEKMYHPGFKVNGELRLLTQYLGIEGADHSATVISQGFFTADLGNGQTLVILFHCPLILESEGNDLNAKELIPLYRETRCDTVCPEWIIRQIQALHF